MDCHLHGVAAKARAFAEKVGLPDHGELIGLVHDLGKYSHDFQAYIKSAAGILNQDEDEDFVDAAGLKGKIDHSTAGAQLVWRQLSTEGQLGEIVGQILALCIASHHSGLIDCLTSEANSLGEDGFGRRMGKMSERSHFDEVIAKADAAVLARAKVLCSGNTILGPLREAISRIVSRAPANDDKSTICQMQIGLLARVLFSCLIDADRIDSADFEKPLGAAHRQLGRYQGWDLLEGRLEGFLAELRDEHPIDRLRRDVSDHCRRAAGREQGIYTLTVPTGGGKTLASLRFALAHARKHGLDRIFYFVPFTTIIDQNAGRVRKILEPPESRDRVVLEHHSNLTPEAQNWRAKILAENWDVPVVFTTNVQFLESLFGAGTRGARRMHQLANAVLIFDEAQALPINCVHLFNNAVNFLVDHCGSTAVLCTATQPLLDRVDQQSGALQLSPSNELMPDIKGLFRDLKRVEVLNRRKPGGWTNSEIADLAMDEARRAGSCLVVVNTKEAARTIYRLCSGSDVETFHLSTNMCAAHRRAVLRLIKRGLGRRPLVCVSTQLIEAGVDIDFGSVVRYAAGLDSIAQAAGRCNRHDLRETGSVHVVNPRDENLGSLADIRIARDKADRVLDDFDADPARYENDRIGPGAMNWYYENYFFARKGEMGYPVSPQALGHSDSLLNLLSTNPVAVHEYGVRNGRGPNIYLRQSFMAASKAFKAIDAPTRGVIVPYRKPGKRLIAEICAAYDAEKDSRLLRAAQRFTVGVFPQVLERLSRAGAIHEAQEGTGILYLDERYYSKDFGLSEKEIAEMEVLDG